MIYRFGPFVLDPEHRTLQRDGLPVAIGPKPVETLLALVEHAGHPIGKDALIKRVWPEGFIDESSLSQNIYILRKVLREGFAADPIETLPRRGYRFTAEVATGMPDSGAPAQPTRPGYLLAVLAIIIIAVAGATVAYQRKTTAIPLDPGSQRIYDLGRFYWEQRTGAAEARAIELFKEVIARQPLSPYGYLGLADAYGVSADYCFVPGECAADWRLARGLVDKALNIAPDFAPAHASAALFATEGPAPDYKRARREALRAIELDANYAPAHHWYGVLLFYERNLEEARIQFEWAVRLDPTSSVMAAWLARDYYFLGRYEDTISFDQQALKISPRIDATATMALAYAKLHQYGKALRKLDDLAGLGTPDKARVLRAYVLARSGDRPGALHELSGVKLGKPGIERRSAREPQHFREVHADDIAAVYAALGERATAERIMGASTNAGDRAWVAVDPRFKKN